jgi:CO dehydrogenase/acetyl-CoA synthase alpha subunit
MTFYKCDRCKETISNPNEECFTVMPRDKLTGTASRIEVYWNDLKFDLCGRCQAEIWNFIRKEAEHGLRSASVQN